MNRSPFLFFVPTLWLLPLACADELHPLTGTQPLKTEVPLSTDNLARVDRLLLKQIEQSPVDRVRFWERDYATHDTYRESIRNQRESLRKRLGAVDDRVLPEELQLVGTLQKPALLAETDRLRVTAVRWSVLDGVTAEGLLLEPQTPPRASVVAIPDADWTPEMLTGLDPQTPPRVAFARRLAESGCRVLVPTIIDRQTTWSGNSRVRRLNQTHREFLYRQAFLLGRHLIGYEVQKVFAAVDYFQHTADQAEQPIGVAGYGEGGLIAFYAAALDVRIQSVLVSGYFQPREQLYREPVYRNVYGLLSEFGDAEIASLIAPRSLTIEMCQIPEAPDPPPLIDQVNVAASGKIEMPRVDEVRREFARALTHYEKLDIPARLALILSPDQQGRAGQGLPGSNAALKTFLLALGVGDLARALEMPLAAAAVPDPQTRMRRQFDELSEYTQKLARQSRFRRQAFWRSADRSSLPRWEDTTQPYREILWNEVIGRLPPATLSPNARTRLLYDTPRWRGYEVLLDVYEGVTTYGVLLVPKDLKKGERRPVVVAQHGRNGTPQDICDPQRDTPYYHSFGAKLADRGFVVYAPQNLYLGEERYRVAQRKAFALGMTIFAPMVRQHEQVLTWLGGLPFVAAERIGFYGLSYGGKSAMLIPAVLKGYCLSICSGDFNEQVWKHTSLQDRFSFMFTLEHEHTEFDFGERFNYAEIAGLIAPRPFMVERGHTDGVSLDEWVAYEYARVRRLYVDLKIADRTTIEFFSGGHEIHAVGTFDFLHKHLQWPVP